MSGSKTHWESIYQKKATTEVSWYQDPPNQSLELIKNASLGMDAAILDAGGGASTLADHLLREGYKNLWILDISGAALERTKARLGANTGAIHWIEGDVTQASLPENHFDLWHDRAVFHFLTAAEDRRRYVETVRRSLKPKGHLVIATFALDGPPRCSGLDVVRYSSESLSAEFGPEFRVVRSVVETHHTPFSTEQKFIYCQFQKSSGK